MPAVLCLQHINVLPNNVTIKDFKLADSTPVDGAKLGTAIYLRNDVTFEHIIIPNNPYQISAIKLFLPDSSFITLLNLYNQPALRSDFSDLYDIVTGLSGPVLAVGDFNSHHPLWDDLVTTPCKAGSNLESFLLHSNFMCLNESDSPTYFSSSHNSFSSVDLSLCSTDLPDRLQWTVLDDCYTSDHFPILIPILDITPVPKPPRFNFDKADWAAYLQRSTSLHPYSPSVDGIDVDCDYITNFIINISNDCIPRSSPHPHRSMVPWWSNDLSGLVRTKHSLGRYLDKLVRCFRSLISLPLPRTKFNKLMSIAVAIKILKPLYNKYTAKFRKAVLQGRIKSWTAFVSDSDSNTSLTTYWKKFQKIKGKFALPPRYPLKVDGTWYHDSKNISNILGKTLANISSSINMDAHFHSLNRNKNFFSLNFEIVDDIQYNVPLTMIELTNALRSCNNSSPGMDDIGFVMLTHLAPSAK